LAAYDVIARLEWSGAIQEGDAGLFVSFYGRMMAGLSS
jgi:hypothetical protein